MPAKIGLIDALPALTTRPMYEIMLVAWVTSRVTIGSGFKIHNSIKSFLDFYHIPPDMWDAKTAEAFYYKTCGIEREADFINITKKIDKWQQMNSTL